MKSFLCFIVLFIVAGNCFSQADNIDGTKQVAAIEKMKFDITRQNKDLSLASNNFQVYYYRCNWNIDPAVRYISGSVTSYFKTTASANQLIYDFTNNLTVDSVIFRKQQAIFSQQTNATLVINFSAVLDTGKKDSVSIYYHGVPPVSGDFTGGFTQTSHAGIPVIWTLSEPYGASGWWPCRNGLDDKADSIDIYITYPSQYKASSNGILVNTATNGSSATAHYKHRYPIASYLVAIAVTNYSIINNNVIVNGHSMPVIQYVYPESLSSFQAGTSTLLNALQLYSNYFGDYPFLKERYGQTQFGWGGGMEHQTNSFVTNSGTHLITHELGHQWFGDKVTCASWQDIWLNEGFATWLADMFYTEKMDTLNYKAYVQNDLADIVSQPGGSVWVDDTTNVNRIFDGRLTYDKGAFLLRMLRWTLGDSLFFKGLNQYLTDPKLAYGFAHTEDLQHHLESAGGVDLDYFFNQWFYGQGFPTFSVQWYQQPSTKKLYVQADETTSVPSSVNFFKVKLPLQLIYGSSAKAITLNCDYNHQQFVLQDPGFIVTNITVDIDKYLISAKDTAIENQNAFATLLEQSEHTITIVPNPVSNVATVILNNISGNTTLQLFSIKGGLLFTKQLNITSAPLSLQVPFTNLAAATYILVVTEQSGTKHHITIVK